MPRVPEQTDMAGRLLLLARAISWVRDHINCTSEVLPDYAEINTVQAHRHLDGLMGQVYRALAALECYRAGPRHDEAYHARVRGMVEGGFLWRPTEELAAVAKLVDRHGCCPRAGRP
jgi:hypothetical protein